jgi:hypothetical protein
MSQVWRHGVCRVSEDADAGVRFSVEQVSEGFLVLKHGENAFTTVMICAECDVII